MNKFLITIAGPTAVGKTATTIKIAQHFGCPILSADSRQIYKEMEIGTAKPSKKELIAAKHHFINHISIHDEYNVGKYENEAISILDKHFEKDNNAILSGGTGFYINAVLEGLDKFPDVSKHDIEHFKDSTLGELQKLLKEHDLVYYNKVDLQNKRRLVRALSIIKASGKPFSSFLNKEKNQRGFIPIPIFLDMDRAKLYDRINLRVDLMVKEGLLEEAKHLYQNKELRSLATVGYQEIFDYFDNKTNLEEAIDLIKRNSRRYAKRQMTWYRNKPEWKRFHPDKVDDIIQYIEQFKLSKQSE